MHSKLEPDSVELKAKLALVEFVVPEGPELIEVLGGVVSGGVVSAGGGVNATRGIVCWRPGKLAGSKGPVPANTSVPSRNPSPSLSALRGFVFVRRTSVQSLSPSLSVSAFRGFVFVRRTSVQSLSPSPSVSAFRGFVFVRWTSVQLLSPSPSVSAFREAGDGLATEIAGSLTPTKPTIADTTGSRNIILKGRSWGTLPAIGVNRYSL